MLSNFPGRVPAHGRRVFQTLFAVIALIVMALAGTAAAHAQAVYGSIFGTVTDASGAVVPNATVSVIDISKNTKVSVQTNSSGSYTVQHLIPDTYRVEVEAGGFSKSTTDNVIVYADTAPKVDVKMTIGSVANTVTVTTAAPLLETDRAEVSTILNARAVENLPNFNRNFTAFELLTPGTTYIGWSVGEGSGNPQRSQQIEVNGQLPFATGYELDGTDNQEPINGVAVINPNLDAVSEMKVTSQNYDAEFGKAVAGLVTAQTKSGSNDFHGSAFEYRRSDAQQARDPFANATRNDLTGKYLAPTMHNQFGGSVGGPVKKDRIFFFGDYQGLREKTGSSTLTTVPTALATSTCTSGGDCNLSDYLQGGQGQIYKPASPGDTTNTGRTPYANNIIPAGDLSPQAVAFFKLLAATPPNAGSGIINNYATSGSGVFNTNQFDVRGDARLGQNLHLFGRYTYFGVALSGDPYFGAAGGLGYGAGGFAGTDSARYQSVASGGDYVVSNTWLTDFRFGYYRIYNNTVGPNSDQPLGNNLGIPNANVGDLSLNGGLPQFNIDIPSNGSNGGQNIEYGTTANPNLQQTSQYQVVNNWSHQVGNHNIKFGADYRYGLNHQVTVASNALRSGTYFFAASRTSGGPVNDASAGLGFATFLLGDTTKFWRTQTADTSAESRQHRFFTYAQDQWHATPKLTVNYGLRWELYTPEAVTARGGGGLLDINSGIVHIAGYGSNNNSLNVKNNFANFAPRLGVAYQIFPNTVFRAGYGLVYGQGWAGDTFGGVLTSSYPVQFQQTDTAASSYADVFNLAQGPTNQAFPTIPDSGNLVLGDGISQTARPTQVRLPTVAGWNAMVQQEITPTLSLQIGYVGSQSYHNMFESSPSFNANEQTLAGFKNLDGTSVINPDNPPCTIDPSTGNPTTTCYYTVAQRSPYYDGTAQSRFGVRYGVPHGWTQRIDYMANSATGSYNALQVVVNKRFANGLQFLSHYTWSHAIGHESYEFLINPAIGRGNGYYNRRQAFVFAGTYDLPFGRNKLVGANSPGWLNQAIGGFQLNGTLTMDGGIPFTTNYSQCSNDNDVGSSDGACFLNKTGGSFNLHKGSYDPISRTVPYMKPSPYVLTSPGTPQNSFGGFSRPAPGTWGNIGRDQLWGPGLVNVDASLAKNFQLRENLRMQLMAQGFNVANHVNYANPNNCVDCVGSNPGTIQGTVASQDGTSMRRLQFAARFTF
ncbi:carboxypeptidase regulatory-like domain-containing protein [Silvibacterium acidisoli]|uniref:carboxypeptidase regulatory-like domain-containing protein n=1 Tax=Acidobacteriaceae bacterium ZG23-2 TaxID=2883246 RepID=UPI00406C573B